MQLSGPVPEVDYGRTTVEIALEGFLFELRMVQGAKFWRQAPEGFDKTELRNDQVDGETERRLVTLLRERAAAGTAVVVVTHSRAVAAVADRVLRMRDGRWV